MTIAAMKRARDVIQTYAPVIAKDADEALTMLDAAISEQEKCEPVACLFHDQYGKLKVSQVWPPESGAFMVFTHPAPVPAGMVLVPVEPTEDMLKELDNTHFGEYNPLSKSIRVCTYKAMLAAAPKEKS